MGNTSYIPTAFRKRDKRRAPLASLVSVRAGTVDGRSVRPTMEFSRVLFAVSLR